METFLYYYYWNKDIKCQQNILAPGHRILRALHRFVCCRSKVMFWGPFSFPFLLRASHLAGKRFVSILFREEFAHLSFSAVTEEEWAPVTPAKPNSHRSDTTIWIKEKRNKVKNNQENPQNNRHIFFWDSFYRNTLKINTQKKTALEKAVLIHRKHIDRNKRPTLH